MREKEDGLWMPTPCLNPSLPTATGNPKCRIDCDDDAWVLSGGANADVRVLDVDKYWMRLEYERRNPATLKKERVIQLVDTADVTCIAIVSGLADDEGER